jgi:alpha-1,6-mannosyltransferase
MRIVRLANCITPRSGGVRTTLRELGAGYLAAGHQPVLIVPGERDSDERTPAGRVITVRAPKIPLSGGYRLLVRKGHLTALLESLRPDRLEVSDRTTLRWTGPWARRHGVPAVMVSHESLTGLLGLGAAHLGWVGGLIARSAAALADALNSRTARQYSHVVCTTRWAAAEFERLGIANLLRIPLGVDLATFHPRQRSAALRARYAGPQDTLIVHCGRLSMEKRPRHSLDAVAMLRASGVRAVLVVAGDGPLRARLNRQAARASLPVHFTGFLTDRAAVATLLATADVVLAPGPVETFGLAALEALACGTPVVGSARSALTEVVGGAGVSVAGEDFAAGALAVLARPEAGRRRAARQRAEEFGWPAAVGSFLAAHGLAAHDRTVRDLGRTTLAPGTVTD